MIFYCTICWTTQLYVCNGVNISLPPPVTWLCLCEWETYLAKGHLTKHESTAYHNKVVTVFSMYLHLSYNLEGYNHWILTRCFCWFTFCYWSSKNPLWRIHALARSPSAHWPPYTEVLCDCYSFWLGSVMVRPVPVKTGISKEGAALAHAGVFIHQQHQCYQCLNKCH